jgi:hypothetical protein
MSERPEHPSSGLSSGDPLGDPAPGYTSPPPPGAGGLAPTAAAGVRERYVLSGWWRRAGAQLIDGC